MIDILKLDIGKARFGNIGAACFDVDNKFLITRIAAEIKNPANKLEITATEVDTTKQIEQLSRAKNWSYARKRILSAYNNNEDSRLSNYIIIERQKAYGSKNSFWYLNNEELTDSKEDCKKFELIYKLLEKLKSKNLKSKTKPTNVDIFVKALTPDIIKPPGNKLAKIATNKSSVHDILESLQYRITVGMHKLFNVPMENIK